MKAPIIEGPPEGDEAPRSLLSRLGWFALLWVGGLLATAGAAYALKAFIM